MHRDPDRPPADLSPAFVRGLLITVGIIMTVLIVGSCLDAALAHPRSDLDDWLEEWSIEAEAGLNVGLLSEYRDMAERHPCYFKPSTCVSTTAAARQATNSAPRQGKLSEAQVRTIVARYFKPGDVETAVRVAWCESRFDPGAKNPRSSASGLFQHLARYWPSRAAKAGVPGASIWDADANARVSAWLVYHGGGWSHWTCY